MLNARATMIIEQGDDWSLQRGLAVADSVHSHDHRTRVDGAICAQ